MLITMSAAFSDRSLPAFSVEVPRTTCITAPHGAIPVANSLGEVYRGRSGVQGNEMNKILLHFDPLHKRGRWRSVQPGPHELNKLIAHAHAHG